jgi:hypothetical protein
MVRRAASPRLWRVKSEPGKDAGSPRIEARYAMTEDAAW